MLILYDDVFSPYARKVRIALYEKGVPFERASITSEPGRVAGLTGSIINWTRRIRRLLRLVMVPVTYFAWHRR